MFLLLIVLYGLLLLVFCLVFPLALFILVVVCIILHRPTLSVVDSWSDADGRLL